MVFQIADYKRDELIELLDGKREGKNTYNFITSLVIIGKWLVYFGEAKDSPEVQC